MGKTLGASTTQKMAGDAEVTRDVAYVV